MFCGLVPTVGPETPSDRPDSSCRAAAPSIALGNFTWAHLATSSQKWIGGYAIVFPGRKSAFRIGFLPDCYRESTEIFTPAGRRLAGEPTSVFSR